jgi:hypothetical protein
MAIDHRYRYISEAVWLPTYIGIAALVLGTINNPALATAVGLASALVCRMLLELLYRIAFGETRLQLRIQLATFSLQLLVWILVWGWYVQRTTAS